MNATTTTKYDVVKSGEYYHAFTLATINEMSGVGKTIEEAVSDLEARHPQLAGKLERTDVTVPKTA